MNSRIFPLFVSAFLVTAVTCDSGPINDDTLCVESPIPGVLMPLEEGNYWEYVEVDHNGAPTDSLRFELLREVRHQQFTEDRRFLPGAMRLIGSEPPDFLWLWSNEDDGTHISGIMNDADTAALDVLTYHFPATVGMFSYSRTWSKDKLTGKYVVRDSTYRELVSVNEDVETPAGTFTTYVYRFFVPPPSEDVWLGNFVFEFLAPGTGLVARMVYGELREDRSGPWNSAILLSDHCVKEPTDS